MKVDLTDLSPVKKKMEVEVPPEEVARHTDEVLRGYQQRARIPGFRPGKAPLAMIRARFADAVREDVRERVVSRSYSEAAREKGLHPVGDPVVEELVHEEGQPLRYTTTFEVLPEVALKRTQGIEVRRPKWELKEEEVDAFLVQLQQSRARFVSEEGRSAQPGDAVVTDVRGLPEGGAEFLREGVLIEVGAERNLPEFNRLLPGLKAGDERTTSVSYAADQGGGELAGKTVGYTLRVREVKRREEPALDDDFAREVGEFDSLEALRVQVRADLSARKAHEAEGTLRQSLVDKLLLENPLVLPELLVEAEVRERLTSVVRQLVARGIDPQGVQVDWKELHQRQQEPARKSVHARLVLDALAREAALEVSEAELDEALRREAERRGEKVATLRAQLREGRGLDALRIQLRREKALDYLTSVANIQDGS